MEKQKRFKGKKLFLHFDFINLYITSFQMYLRFLGLSTDYVLSIKKCSHTWKNQLYRYLASKLMMIYKTQNVIFPKTLKVSELDTKPLTHEQNDSKSPFPGQQKKIVVAMQFRSLRAQSLRKRADDNTQDSEISKASRNHIQPDRTIGERKGVEEVHRSPALCQATEPQSLLCAVSLSKLRAYMYEMFTWQFDLNVSEYSSSLPDGALTSCIPCGHSRDLPVMQLVAGDPRLPLLPPLLSIPSPPLKPCTRARLRRAWDYLRRSPTCLKFHGVMNRALFSSHQFVSASFQKESEC